MIGDRWDGCAAGFLWLSLTPAGVSQSLPPGKAKPLVERACTACHELVIGSRQRMDRERWAALVEDMIDRGAELSGEKAAEVIDYLAANFGQKVNINQARAGVLVSELGLSDGEAAALVRFRESHGPFKDLASLKKVPALDAAKLDAVKERIAF